MEIVTVTNLKKLYDDFTAVDDVSFSINEGEVFGFLGPNGAGKTSTINMMIGLSRPTSGEITIDGIDAKNRLKGRKPLWELCRMRAIFMMIWTVLLESA